MRYISAYGHWTGTFLFRNVQKVRISAQLFTILVPEKLTEVSPSVSLEELGSVAAWAGWNLGGMFKMHFLAASLAA